uniref:Rapid alkalinization factor n=1 Tax=Litchi chinensis TaxID=151069 RepID=A7LIT1_LITCN|nr:rapid alkalinization factor precursor [Litchi chinensis]
MRTSNLSGLVLVISAVILAVHVAVSASSAVDFNAGHQFGFFPMKPECSGSIGECATVGDEELDLEFEMDSESNRRILATSQYISYGALRRNSVPCSRRGASYYNCQTGAQANPYSRGCSAITRCRR